MNKRFTRSELGAKTKLELRHIARDCGVEFDNGTQGSELIERILQAQQQQQATVEVKAQPAGMARQGIDALDDDEEEDDDDVQGEKKITVQCGAASLDVIAAGQTVAQLREQLREALNIGQAFVPRVNGLTANANSVLSPGDSLEFVKPSGDKAARSR